MISRTGGSHADSPGRDDRPPSPPGPRSLAFAAIVLAGVFGGGVAKRLSSGGFNDPGAQSTRANNVLRDQFHTGDPNVVLLVTAKAGARSTARRWPRPAEP